MVGRVLARIAVQLLPLATLAVIGSLACATLEEVTPGCGNHVVEATEDCDGGGTHLCGAQDTVHQCRFIWDETHPCPAGYAESPDKRCRKGSGELLRTTSIETPGGDPQVADFGGDGTVELGLIEGFGSTLALYSVSASAADRVASLPIYGIAAMGEVSGDASTDIVFATEAISGEACSEPVQEDGGGAISDESARAGLSVLRSAGGNFSLKVYANQTFGEAVRFTPLPSWLFGSCDIFDLEVLTRIALVGDDDLEICAVDDCEATRVTVPDLGQSQGADQGLGLGLDSNDAYAVVSVQGQTQLLYVPHEGFTSLGDALEPANLTTIKMPPNTRVEAGVVIVDVDADSWDDVVVIGSPSEDIGGVSGLYVLHGKAPEDGDTYATLAGDTLAPWLMIDGFEPADTGGTVLAAGELNGDGIPDFFLGDRVWVSTGIPIPSMPTESASTYYRSECWVANEGSPGGDYCNGSRPAAIGDVNGDGLDDIIGTGGSFGSWTVQLLQGGDSLPLVRVDLPLDTLGTGFVSRLALTDFDGDGAADILGSFVPTQNGEPLTPPESCDAGESLLIAYGNVGSLPDPPTVIAQVPTVRQIAAGKFRSPADGFGDFAVAVTCGSSATLFGDPFRRVSSPFLFDDAATSSFRPFQVAIRDVMDSADDFVDADGAVVPHADLIVSGDDSSGEPAGAVLLLPSWADAELDLDAAVPLDPPAGWRDAVGGQQRAAIGIEAQHGVVGMAGIVLTYDFEGDQTFDYALSGGWSVATLGSAGAPASVQLPFKDDGIQIVIGENEAPDSAPFARVAMADLNGDQLADFVVVYGISLASYDAFTGGDVESAQLGGRVLSKVVLAVSEGDTWVAKPVSGLANEDAAVDVVVLDGELLLVTEQSLYSVAADGTSSLHAVLGIETPAREAAIGDFSGDGLNDMMVFDGSRGYLLEQQPLNP